MNASSVVNVSYSKEENIIGLIMYALLYSYFLGLSFRSTAKALDPFIEKRRSHVAVWNWVQLFNPNKLFYLKRTRVTAFIIDETMVKIGSDYTWFWVAIEPVHKQVLGVYVSRHRNMLVAESFLRSLIKIYGKHTVYSDRWWNMVSGSMSLSWS